MFLPDQHLFTQEMQWGEQPVRLTAWRADTLPDDAPTTSVHIVAFQAGKVLVVRDRRGNFGFPGGRLEAGETCHDALVREVYEEAQAHLKPGYDLFAILKIECTVKLPHRQYPHDHSYMAVYAGALRALDPIGVDPAGIITGRDLFSPTECSRSLSESDRILLKEALKTLNGREEHARQVRAFLANGTTIPAPRRPVRPGEPC